MSEVAKINRAEPEESLSTLEANIAELEGKQAISDPRFLDSDKRLKELKLRPSQIEADIKTLEAELIEKEKHIAKEVLAGGAAAVSGLSKLREKIADLREERRIFETVIEQATTAHKDLREELEATLNKKRQHVLKAALSELSTFFDSARDTIELVKRSATLARAFHLNEDIQSLERMIRELSARASR